MTKSEVEDEQREKNRSFPSLLCLQQNGKKSKTKVSRARCGDGSKGRSSNAKDREDRAKVREGGQFGC